MRMGRSDHNEIIADVFKRGHARLWHDTPPEATTRMTAKGKTIKPVQSCFVRDDKSSIYQTWQDSIHVLRFSIISRIKRLRNCRIISLFPVIYVIAADSVSCHSRAWTLKYIGNRFIYGLIVLSVLLSQPIYMPFFDICCLLRGSDRIKIRCF